MSAALGKPGVAINRRQVLILAVGAMMVGSFCLLVLLPQYRELSLLGKAVDQQQNAVSSKVRTCRDGLYLSARIPGLRKAERVMRATLPPQPERAAFLEDVNRCVEAEPGVTHEVRRGPARSDGPLPAESVHLTLRGPCPGVYRSIAAIERLRRSCRFHTVSMRRATDGTVVAETDLRVHYLPDLAGDTDEPKKPGEAAGEASADG